jgi:hypothetical protein
MPAHITDFPSGVNLAASLNPTTLGTSANGSSVDMIGGDGACFAIQHVGDVDEDGTLTGRIEQSADGTNWSAISGATFAQVAAPNNLQVIRFTRTARYVRWAATITGSSVTFTAAALIGEVKKTY